MHTDNERRIVRFEEKPKKKELLDELCIPAPLLKELGQPADAELFQASMGIYIFNREVLVKALDNDCADFGKHVIPDMLGKFRVHSYIYQGYWEDIGTIRAFFDSNLQLTDPVPAFNFFDTATPIYTHARFLPGSKINGATIKQAIVSDGCIIDDAHIERAVIGIRSYIKGGTTIRESIVMGADFYDVDQACPRRSGAGHRKELRDRPRDHRQKRPHRRRLRDHARRQAGQFRRSEFLRSRRDRGRAQGREHRRRDVDLRAAGSGRISCCTLSGLRSAI